MPKITSADKLAVPLHWSKDHLFLRNEAHHRATLSCEAPAIVWHVGFWPERHKDPQDAMNADAFNHRLKNWIEERVQVLVERLLALGQPSGARQPKSFWIDENNNLPEIKIWTAKPKAEEFVILWRGIKVQTRIEIHPDYAAATFIVSLGDQDAEESREAGDTEDETLDVQDPFIFGLREAVKNASNAEAEVASQASQLLFSEAWRRFIRDVLEANGLSYDEALIPGEIFVSLRGTILELDQNVSVLNAPKLSKDETFSPFEAHNTIMSFEAFLSRGGFKKDDREFVAARIVQERAIFISPFGARSLHEERDDPDHPDPRRSTRFTILAKGEINSRQLGRTVSQINSLGTLQIIALKDIAVIRAVGTAIRLENEVLDECAKELTDAIQRRNRVSHAIELKLCQLELRLDDLANLPTGGLSYRVVRSRYYANEFERRLKNLDSQEVSRWQKPETFFAKRLFSVFDYIQNVGTRMERLRRRISDSLETIQTKTLVDLTRGVHNIQSSGEILSAILFITAVSTFSGEVLAPAYQVGFSSLQLLSPPAECVVTSPSLPDICKAAFRLNGYLLGALVAAVALFAGRFVWKRVNTTSGGS